MKKLLALFFLLITKLSATIYLEPTPQFKPCIEVATVYIEYDSQILLLHHQNNKSQGNKWGIPGGKVEKNETPLQAVIKRN
jgi:ADP-ribose pyrophosphatase YjhB (NUDIX family)